MSPSIKTLSHAHEGSRINNDELLGIIWEHTRTQKKKGDGNDFAKIGTLPLRQRYYTHVYMCQHICQLKL